MKLSNKSICRTLGLVILLLATAIGLQAAEPWKPVDPAQLALKASTVEKDADAEALWWEMRVEKSEDRALIAHYLRIKIFNDRGRESQSTVELPYYDKLRIRDIAARTIKPDGQIIELNPADIFDKQVVRARKLKVNVKSFALPGVEPGAIIEYRWVEEYQTAYYFKQELQRDIPVQRLQLAIKGKAGSYTTQKMIYYHMQDPLFRDDGKDFRVMTLTNVPAFQAEPQMPCVDCVRPWVLFYTTVSGFSLGNPWDVVGKEEYQTMASKTKPNDELRRTATEVIGNAATTEQKLERLYEFCRKNIRNTADPQMSETERAGYRENKSAGDVLRSKLATGREINMLFAALAGAAGFNARLALVADRGTTFFDRGLTDNYYMAGQLKSYNIAVDVDGKWRFFDPATTYLSYGMLRWQEEGRDALITDPVHSVFVTTPLSTPGKTMTKRSGTLKLSTDGALEGDVRTEYTGHTALEFRLDDLALTPQQREESLIKQVKERLGNAELTNIQIENLTDPAKPLVYSYHLRIANYAQRTSKRLIFEPNCFTKGRAALFSASTRKYPIVFSYPWSEQDELRIEFPEGFELDLAEGTTPLRADNVALNEVRNGN